MCIEVSQLIGELVKNYLLTRCLGHIGCQWVAEVHKVGYLQHGVLGSVRPFRQGHTGLCGPDDGAILHRIRGLSVTGQRGWH